MINFQNFSKILFTNFSQALDKIIPLKHAALLNTTNEWFVNTDKGKYNLAVFIDLRKAFDTVNHDIFLFRLRHYGVIGAELRQYKSYVSNRHQYCSLSDSYSDLALVISGIPQGSCYALCCS